MHDTAPPSPPAQAALDACTDAALALRRAYSRLVGTVGALHGTDAVTETGHRSLGRLLEEILRVDAGEARRLIRHATVLTTDLAVQAGRWCPTPTIPPFPPRPRPSPTGRSAPSTYP